MTTLIRAWISNNWRQALLVAFALAALAALIVQNIRPQEHYPGYGLLFEQAGRWAIRFLLLCLAMTPLNTYFGWRWAIKLRKTAGLCAFGFGALHFGRYAVEVPSWLDSITTLYYGPGALGLAILLALALTSTRWAMKRMGKNWKRLHRLVYIAALAVAVHAIIASGTSKIALFRTELSAAELNIFLVLLVILLAVRLPLVREALLRRKRPRAAPG